MTSFKFFWSAFRSISLAVTDFITNLFLFTFYYSIFALFALPFKLFSHLLSKNPKNSNWVIKDSTPSALKDFQNE